MQSYKQLNCKQRYTIEVMLKKGIEKRIIADRGYSSVTKQYYMGYKLDVVVSSSGVFHAMDMSKACVHDVRYLSDVKHSGLNNCVLLGDKGYLSSEMQLDLFTSVNVKLKTPMRS